MIQTTALIIEDQPKAREEFKKMLLQKFPQINIAGLASSVQEAIKLIKQHKPELIFLDVELPGGNGFKLFEYFPQPSFEVIFITAYTEHAIKAIRLAALDYLEKPIDPELLTNAVNRFFEKQKIQFPKQRFELLLENSGNSPGEFNKIAIPVLKGFIIIKLNDINYCKGDGNYTQIHQLDGTRLTSTKTLKYFGELLPSETFFRCHKSHIINLNLAKKVITEDGHRVIMQNGEELNIGDDYRKRFVEKIIRKNKSGQ